MEVAPGKHAQIAAALVVTLRNANATQGITQERHTTNIPQERARHVTKYDKEPREISKKLS